MFWKRFRADYKSAALPTELHRHNDLRSETPNRLTERLTPKYFTDSEFACRHCGLSLMDEAFVTRLDALRERVGFPLVVSSGYRCPEHNVAVSTTGPRGPHTTGKAVDLRVDRERAYKVLSAALRMGFKGIGVHQKGESRFIHLDDLEGPGRPTVWSY